MSWHLGAHVTEGTTRFAVRAPLASGMDLCLFDKGGETCHPMERHGDDWRAELPGNLAGTRYGYRAHGDWKKMCDSRGVFVIKKTSQKSG